MEFTDKQLERGNKIASEFYEFIDTQKVKFPTVDNLSLFQVFFTNKLAQLELKQEELTKWLAEMNIKLLTPLK